MEIKKFLILALFLPYALFGADLVEELDELMRQICSEIALKRSIGEIYSFNHEDRSRWVKEKAASVKEDSWVLDLGAGTCPYKSDFSHCVYFSQDFMQYEGEKLGGTTDYGEINFICDITEIPVLDNTFDALLCTEVLEHVIDPFVALDEIARVVKPGGRIFLSSSYSCGLNQEPYHYYSGFTPYWYEKVLQERGFEIIEIRPNGGFFKMLSQECVRVIGEWDRHKNFHKPEDRAAIVKLFGEVLPRFLFDLDGKCPFYQFTVGYFIEAKKKEAQPSK